MLRKVRIEVEEHSAEACVEALNKYEHAIQQQEAKRYQHLWPVDEEGHPPIEDVPWKFGVAARRYYDDLLGREIREEVIEFDPLLPGYRGRRIAIYDRIDTRHPVYSDDKQATAEANDQAVRRLASIMGPRQDQSKSSGS
jgi:hypothetical protein